MAQLKAGTSIGGYLGLYDSVPNATFNTSLSIVTGASNKVYIAQAAAGATYNFLSLNATTAEGVGIGLIAGATGDPDLYLNSGNAGDIHFRTGTGSAYNVRATLTNAGNFSATGTVTGSNLSGTNTGDQTNISGVAAGNWPNEGSWKPSSLSGQTRLRGITSPDGGEFATAYSGGQVYAYCDGWFYQNEGQYRCLDTADYATAATASKLVMRDSNGDTTSRYNFSTYNNTSDDANTGTVTYIMAKFGDNYHRSATAAKVASFISGQTMNISGSSTSCSGAASSNVLKTGDTMTGTLRMEAGAYDGLITFGSTSTWRCGIRQYDSADAELRIFATNSAGMIFMATGYNGESTTTRPTDGLCVQSNNVGIGDFSSSDPGYDLHVKGSIGSTGDITGNLSDKRLKTNIEPILKPLDKIDTLSGFTYNNNELAASFGYDTKERRVGIFAQDLQKVLPEAVKPAPFDVDACSNSISGENYLTIQYERIVPLLIEAIKELRAEVNELKKNRV